MLNENKTIYLFILLECFLLLYQSSHLLGQCPHNLFIGSQTQLTTFINTYPNCTTITGNLTIEGYHTDRIQDLSAFNQITKIEGNLFIGNHLSLQNLNGLQHLEQIGGDLTISHNPTLTNLTDLINLSIIEGSLNISNCPKLETVLFPKLQEVRKNLTVFYNASLFTLTGFKSINTIGRDLKILKNPLIPNLMGLEQLQKIGGGLIVYHNDSLSSLEGLDNLQSIEDRIILVENERLANCNNSFCYRFDTQQINDGYIKENACGCNSFLEIKTTCLGDTVNCNPTFTISGTIQTSINKPIPGVSVQLSGEVASSMLTNENGIYSFEDLPIGEYYIEATKTGDYINGVTLVDASLILQHATDTLSLLNDPYKVLAADIDLSQSITNTDGDLVKQLAQGAIDIWDAVDAWGFIRSSFDFGTAINSPWEAIEKETRNSTIIHIPILNRDHFSSNFIGYKYGDVNNSVRP